MYDASKADLFLQYTNGAGVKNGTVYNERQVPGDQYFWDFRNAAAGAYYISSVLASIDYPETDGSFTDDVTGLPAEHGSAPGNMKLSAADVAEIQYATSFVSGQLIARAVDANKYIWAAFKDQDGVSAGPTAATCATWARARCTAEHQLTATTQAFDTAHVNQSIAAFLVVLSGLWLGVRHAGLALRVPLAGGRAAGPLRRGLAERLFARVDVRQRHARLQLLHRDCPHSLTAAAWPRPPGLGRSPFEEEERALERGGPASHEQSARHGLA